MLDHSHSPPSGPAPSLALLPRPGPDGSTTPARQPPRPPPPLPPRVPFPSCPEHRWRRPASPLGPRARACVSCTGGGGGDERLPRALWRCPCPRRRPAAGARPWRAAAWKSQSTPAAGPPVCVGRREGESNRAAEGAARVGGGGRRGGRRKPSSTTAPVVVALSPLLWGEPRQISAQTEPVPKRGRGAPAAPTDRRGHGVRWKLRAYRPGAVVGRGRGVHGLRQRHSKKAQKEARDGGKQQQRAGSRRSERAQLRLRLGKKEGPIIDSIDRFDFIPALYESTHGPNAAKGKPPTKNRRGCPLLGRFPLARPGSDQARQRTDSLRKVGEALASQGIMDARSHKKDGRLAALAVD